MALSLEEKIRITSGQAELDLDSQKRAIAIEREEYRQSVRDKRRMLADLHADNKDNLLPTVAALNAHERRNYSLGRALSHLCKVRAGDRDANCMESEIGHGIAADLKMTPRAGGMFIPTRIFASGQDTNTNAAGKYLVTTGIRDLADQLRSQLRLAALGASFIDGLRRPTQFTTELTASKAYWISENGGADVSQQDLSFGAVTLFAHTLQSTVQISRQLLQQNSVSLDRRIGMDITRSVAIALEAAAINGSGSEGQPLGLLRVPGISTVSINTNGGTPTYDHLTQMEQAVADSNADFAANGFLSTPAIRKKLRNTFINSTGSLPVWVGDRVLEKPALATTGVPSTLSKGTSNGNLHAIIYGNWSEMLIAEFAVMELTVDPFTRKKQGVVEVTSFSLVDVGVPRPAAFSVCVDASLS